MTAGTHRRPESPGGHIPLWKVLEDEFVVIHGPLPSQYKQARDQVLARLARGGRTAAFDSANSGVDDEANREILPELYRCIHALEEKRTALCLSGGGIRSATFGLGVMQGLARNGLLGRFDFLSTVSGGGYIGSWITAWIHHHPDGRRGVLRELCNPPTSPLDAQPHAIAHLRDHSNYLMPKLGVLSADAWTLVAAYIRNLMLNWLVLLPLLAIGLMVPRLAMRPVEFLKEAVPSDAEGAKYADPLFDWAKYQDARHFVTACIVGGIVFQVIAFVFMDRNRPSLARVRVAARRRRWFPARRTRSRTQGWFLVSCWLPLITSTVLLSLAWWGLSRGAIFRYDVLDHVLPDCIVRRLPWPTAAKGDVRIRGLEAFMAFQCAIVATGWLANLGAHVMRLKRYGCRGMVMAIGELALGLVAAAICGALLFGASNLPVFNHRRSFVVLSAATYLLILLITGGLLRGLISIWNPDEDREWSARAAGWVLIAAVVWFVSAELVLFAPSYLLRGGPAIKTIILSAGGVAGVATALLGKSGRTPASTEQASKPGSPANRAQGGKLGAAALARQIGLAIAAPVFVATLLVAIALATDVLLVRFKVSADGLTSKQVDEAVRGQEQLVTWLREQQVTLTRLSDPVANPSPQLTRKELGRWREDVKRLKTDLTRDPAKGRLLERNRVHAWLTDQLELLDELDAAMAKSEQIPAEDVRALLLTRLRGTHDASTGADDDDAHKMGVTDMLEWEDTQLRPLLEGEDRHSVTIKAARMPQMWVWIGIFLFVALVMGWTVDINKFSLHGVYRNRLIRAYLGASRPTRDRSPTYDRFTGFDPRDDVGMHELRRAASMPEGLGSLDPLRWATLLAEEAPDDERLPSPAVIAFLQTHLRRTCASLGNWSPAQPLPQEFPRVLRDDLDKLVGHSHLYAGVPFASLLSRNECDALKLNGMPLPGLPEAVRLNIQLLYRAMPYDVPRPGRLFHVLNMALNLVSGRRLAWQQRKAESFTASPLHCGSNRLGYRDASEYGGGRRAWLRESQPMTLGTAMAISGAAANPNWGYHSSPSVAFLMTLLNVRLGFPAHWDPKLRIPRGQVVAAASIVSPKY